MCVCVCVCVCVRAFVCVYKAALGRRVGLVIDLTNSDRYYNGSAEFRDCGVAYVRIRERGHSSVPRYFVLVKQVN